MRRIQIADTTLCREEGSFSFKEKLEIARWLEHLKIDFIELPEIVNTHADILLVRTAASFVKTGTLSVGAGSSRESIENAIAALSSAVRPRVRIELPVSPVGMEYLAHRKPQKMLEWIAESIQIVKGKGMEAEFCAVDATRAEPDFLRGAIRAAIDNGADSVTVCDSAAEMSPDDFGDFVEQIASFTSVPFGIRCENRNGLACAEAMLAVRRGASIVKTSVGGATVPLELFAGIIHDSGNRYGIEANLRLTDIQRIVKQIRWVSDGSHASSNISTSSNEQLRLDETSSLEEVSAAVVRLGYDLSEEDLKKVYEEFLRTASKKDIGTKELDAIIAGTALQVPSTYQLVSYVVNSSNVVSSSAQISLSKEGKESSGVSIGDGPIAAAFSAIEQIVGQRYELDDFQIQSVTEGREALGSALVRLRSNGRLYAGKGISTDIIGAAIRAYLSAVNKMIYEEVQSK